LGMAFVAPNLEPIVWYYTRGLVVSSASATKPTPTFLVCAKGSTDAPTTTPCDGFPAVLREVGSPTGAGYTLSETSNYLIYALPFCGSSQPQLSQATALCSSSPPESAPPTLEPIGSGLDARFVGLTVTLLPNVSSAHVDYTYAQSVGIQEAGSVVRLEVARSDNTWCAIAEVSGQRDFTFAPASSARMRAMVIPRSATAAGQEYFSAVVEVTAPKVVTLPNIVTGGTQDILAFSLEDAEKIALSAGTWSPAAGTLGPDAIGESGKAPPADHSCRD